MDKLLPKMYKSYGEYINQSRSFPLDLDGCKPVERRTLLAAYQIARDKFVKCAKIDGHTIANYHPHGTVYGCTVQLVRNKFLIGQGNFGSTVGVESSPPAAMRYTEAKLSKNIEKLAFKLINHVPWIESELEDEPEFLPTMFPLCLLGTDSCQGIGFGYRTYIPSYKIEDLYKRLLWLLGIEKTKPTIKPSSDCKITANTADLERLLTKGKSVIKVEGTIHVEPAKCKVTVKSWPPGRSFQTLLNKFAKQLNNADIGFTDLSTTETKIVFEVLKQRSRDDIFKKFVSNLQKALKGTISYEANVVDKNKKVRNASIDEMLLNTYKMYTEVNKTMLSHEIKQNQNLISEYQILAKIRPILSKHLKAKIVNVPETIKKIAEEAKVDQKIVNGLFTKYSIHKLLTLNTDITDLTDKVNSLNSDLKNIDKFVLDQYKEIVK